MREQLRSMRYEVFEIPFGHLTDREQLRRHFYSIDRLLLEACGLDLSLTASSTGPEAMQAFHARFRCAGECWCSMNSRYAPSVRLSRGNRL